MSSVERSKRGSAGATPRPTGQPAPARWPVGGRRCVVPPESLSGLEETTTDRPNAQTDPGPDPPSSSSRRRLRSPARGRSGGARCTVTRDRSSDPQWHQRRCHSGATHLPGRRATARPLEALALSRPAESTNCQPTLGSSGKPSGCRDPIAKIAMAAADNDAVAARRATSVPLADATALLLIRLSGATTANCCNQWEPVMRPDPRRGLFGVLRRGMRVAAIGPEPATRMRPTIGAYPLRRDLADRRLQGCGAVCTTRAVSMQAASLDQASEQLTRSDPLGRPFHADAAVGHWFADCCPGAGARRLGRVRGFAADLPVRSKQALGRLDGDRCLVGRSDAVARLAVACGQAARSRRLLKCRVDPAVSGSG